MKGLRILSLAAAMALAVGTLYADDELGKKPKPKPPTSGGGSSGGGNSSGGGSGSSGGGSKPPQSSPPQSKPPQNNPPQNKPPQNNPPQGNGNGNGNGGGNNNGGGDSGLGKPRPGGSGGSSGGGSGSGGSNSGGSGGGKPVIIGGGNGGNNGNGQGNGGNNDRLGRIDNGQQSRPRQGNDNELGKSGRRDKVYNTVNNGNRGERDGGPGRIGNAPIDVVGGSLQNQVRREERISARYPNDCRQGYYSYNRGWCDDDFWYSHYVFTPVQNCSVSPWYYYHHLPGYIKIGNIVFLNDNRDYRWRGTSYNYRPYYGGGSWFNDNRNDCDYSVDDIVNMFERRDRRALGRLLPRRGNIDIYFERRYTYSVDVDEFYDLMLDAVMTTRTQRYEIVRVERNGDEMEVQARHHYRDPWGRTECVYHWYRLEWERDGYVITKFGTTNRSAW